MPKSREELQEENERLRSAIQEMVRLAGQNHRPAYDEQQRIIMSLREEIALLKAEVSTLKEFWTDED